MRVVWQDMDEIGDDDKMCSFWFNTAFVDRQYLVFDKAVIDGANKDKKHSAFNKQFKVEVQHSLVLFFACFVRWHDAYPRVFLPLPCCSETMFLW